MCYRITVRPKKTTRGKRTFKLSRVLAAAHFAEPMALPVMVITWLRALPAVDVTWFTASLATVIAHTYVLHAASKA